MADAALLSLRIVHLHRVPDAVPAAGSCSNAAAGNHCGNSGREARLDNSAMDSVALHLHSIADAGRVPSIVDSGASHGEWLTEVPVKKKIK